ncbi:MAG: FtsX-like permease family protein, partial [Limisphaerales bacterium]
ACANVAGLLLARGLQRRQEYAVRCALGAQRSQLFRQVLTESLLVSLGGGVLGIGLAAGIVQTLKAIGGHAIPRLDSVSIGWPVLAFCLAVVIAAAIAAGLVPAFHATRSNSTEGIKGTRTSSLGRMERRWLGSIVTVQIALTLALLMGAGLLIRTMINLAGVLPGYATENILTMDVTPVDGLKTGKWISTEADMLTRVAVLPGIRNVAFAWGVPLTDTHWMTEVRFEDQSETDSRAGTGLQDEVAIPTRSVTADYFDMLNMALVAGRGFRQSDGRYGPGGTTNAPIVAVANQAMARKYFAGQDLVGKKIRFTFGSDDASDNKWTAAQIIGVVADSRDGSLVQKPEPELYLYFYQMPAFTKRLVIRTLSDPRTLIGVVQRDLRAIDPTVAIDHIETMHQIRADSIASQTFAMRLLAGFSLVGTVLALVGIYGVLSLSVGSRKQEIAIRMAVGAQRRNILGLVLSEGLRLIVGGFLIGIVISLGMGRLLQAFLFGVQPADPVTFIAVVILFTVIALLACFIPARRATRIDPMTSLRYE